jgi:hypothetical protein
MFNEFQTDIDAWLYNDLLTAFEVACLLAGYNPNDHSLIQPHDSKPDSYYKNNSGRPYYLELSDKSDWPADLWPLFSAVRSAIDYGHLPASIVHAGGGTHMQYIGATYTVPIGEGKCKVEYTVLHEPDWNKTRVFISEVRKWLHAKGRTDNVFFLHNQHISKEPYLDTSHSRYSSKLAAAVTAWMDIEENQDWLKNKSPKQAITKRLNEIASQFGLTGEDGKPINQAITDISKVANWDTTGGAPKTYLQIETHTPLALNSPDFHLKHTTPLQERAEVLLKPRQIEAPYAEMDDDIPF